MKILEWIIYILLGFGFVLIGIFIHTLVKQSSDTQGMISELSQSVSVALQYSEICPGIKK